jgi:hypothetical protein
MIPTHSEGLAAAKRVAAANEDGEMVDAQDSITMSLYNLSLQMRLLPERYRMKAATVAARQLIANTRESLD